MPEQTDRVPCFPEYTPTAAQLAAHMVREHGDRVLAVLDGSRTAERGPQGQRT